LQATTLTFVIVATVIGQETGKLTSATSSALVAAGLLSAALFPAGAARLLAPRGRGEHRAAPAPGVDGPAADADGIDGPAADPAGVDGPAVPAQPEYSPRESAVPER
jgi:hypothetical protein